MFHRKNHLIGIFSAAAVGLVVGCDERVADVAREAADRQATQNLAMAELHKEVASGTRTLVKSDAEARRNIVAVHRDLLAERTRLDSSWHDLETQRQQLASQRRTESALVALTKIAGGLALVVVLVGFSWYALVALRTNASEVDAELSEFLIEELTAERPRLLAADRSLARPAAHGELPATAD